MEKNTSDFGEIYFDLIDEQIIRLDSKFRIIKTNQSAKDFFSQKGISDFQGLTCQELCIFRDVEGNHVCPAIEAKKTKKIHSEELMTGDGETWLVKVYPILDNSNEIKGFFEVSFEITEQKKMQSELKENSEILKSIIQFSPRGFVAFKGRNNVVITNPALEEMLGYSHEELKEKTLLGITHPEDVEMSKAVSDKALEEQKHVVFEKRYITKDGRILPALVVTWGTYDEEGDWIYNFGSIEDISSRIEADEALKESEKRFRTIFEQAREGFLLRELDGTVIVANQSLFDIFGYPRFDAKGRNIKEFTPYVSEEILEEKTRETLEKGFNFYEVQARKSDGSIIPLEVQSNLNKIGEEESVFSVFRDISERKQAEEALKKSENRFRTIFEHSMDSYWLRGIDGTIIDVNPSFEEMTGYQHEELIGKSVYFLISGRDGELEQFNEILLKEGKSLDEIDITKKDGSLVPVEISTLLLEIEGEPVVFGVGRDNSERKATEELKREAYAQIDKNIENFEILVDKIRNPLTVIIGAAELNDLKLNNKIIENAVKITEITQLMTSSWDGSAKFRLILQKQLLKE